MHSELSPPKRGPTRKRLRVNVRCAAASEHSGRRSDRNPKAGAGKGSQSDALKFARSGRMKFLSYRTSDIHVRVYGDAAVVTGRLQRTRSMNGQEISDDWRFTKTYIRESQKWRVVAFHASEAAQP